MLKIAITDDHKLFRKSLSMLINSFEGMQVALEAESGPQLLEKLQETEIDILLLDIQMPGMNGLETCQHVQNRYSDVLILIISQLDDPGTIQKVMNYGANGYFTKNSSPSELETAIKSLNEKGFYFEKKLSSVIQVLLQEEQPAVNNHHSPITDREMDVVRLAAKELSGKEIADNLSISLRTVEVHKKNLMKKTHSKNFLGVILFAISNKYLSLAELDKKDTHR